MSQAGYGVTGAADDTAALSLVREGRTVPDLILLDGLIPNRDPAEICRRYACGSVEEITGVPLEQVERAARLLWEARPVAYYAWSGVEQQTAATQIFRAIAQLYALTGSFDVPGGNVLFPSVPSRNVAGDDLLSPAQRGRSLGVTERPLGPARWEWVATDPVYRQATTACLTAVVVTQVANGFVCRSPHASVFSLGLFTNRLLLVGMLVEVGLQLTIVYSPFGQKIFGTAALPLSAWLVALPFALLLFAADEARKALAGRFPMP